MIYVEVDLSKLVASKVWFNYRPISRDCLKGVVVGHEQA